MRRICLFLIFFMTILGCKKDSQNNRCSEGIKLSSIEKSRGNIYYIHKANYSDVTEYFIFKKYGFIDYIQLHSVVSDSCFKKEMNKNIESIIKKNIKYLNTEVEKLKKEEELNFDYIKKGYQKFLDSIYLPSVNVDYPLMRYPMQERNFKEYLIEAIKEIDDTYDSSSFWIVINKKGEVEKIEKYKKHSFKIDSFIESELKKTHWVPAIDKTDSTFVSSRIIFMLKKW